MRRVPAIALTRTGGIIGILLGWSITEIFGLYPAMRAARLHPIQALRYE